MKNIAFYIIAFLLLVILIREGCNGYAINRQAKKITKLESVPPKVVRDVDTVYLDTTDVKPTYVPKPYPVAGPIQYIDTGSSSPVVLYRDTVTFQYGNVVINDRVQGSLILSRQPTFNLQVPTIRETVVQQTKKRNEVYAGVQANYRSYDSALAVGPSLMLKTKRGTAYEVGASFDTRGKFVYSAGVKFKLSIRK